MKILYLCHADPDVDFSGTPLIAEQYIMNLNKKGHDCALLLPMSNKYKTINKSKQEKIKKFYWPFLDNWKVKAFENIPFLHNDQKIEINFKPDIIHVLTWANFSPSVFDKLKSFNVPIIRHVYGFEDFCYFGRPIFYHNDHSKCEAPLSEKNCSNCIIKNEDVNFLEKIKSIISNKKKKIKNNLRIRKFMVNKHFENYFDHLIFSSKFFADFFLKHHKSSKPYSLIKHGIKEPQKTFQKNDDDFVNIIFCGATEPAKGWFIIEDVFFKILKNYSFKFNLRIYGNKKVTSKSKLSYFKNVSFYDEFHPKDIDEIFGWADLGIAPFLFETYSRIIREFMIRGVVPIGTDAFGIPEVINDKYNGFLIKKPFKKNLFDILKNILENKKQISEMRNNLKKADIISPDQEMQDIMKIYKKLSETSPQIKI
jgi:glycosyltransferase involved in cell wall biosynthesis